jgi:mannose-6-phosphate isomerase-like protein (cupin superfamily)
VACPEREDEFFLVLDGKLEIEVDGGETFVLGPQVSELFPQPSLSPDSPSSLATP